MPAPAGGQGGQGSSGRATLLRPAWVLAEPDSGVLHAGWSVRVEGERIVAAGPHDAVDPGAAQVVDLPDALLMPGLVNAHQHGRGLSQLQLGYPDAPLEPWIAQRVARGSPDAFALTQLAAAEMLRNGVTTAVHANYSYGSGDYEAEARATLDAYIGIGLRVTFCVGAMDRAPLVYPEEAQPALLESMPPAARDYLEARAQGRRPPYAGDAARTIALMDRLQADYGGHPLVTLAYGPAGPQWVSDDMLAALAQDARARGLGLHMHLLESPVQARVARERYPDGAVLHLERLGVLGPRTVLAHCVHLEPRDIAVMARSGCIAVHNPGSNLRLSNGLAPLAELLQAGVPVAIGTDNCALADTEDLLAEMRLADVLARRDPARYRFDAARLLGCLTATGARAAFVEQQVGRIAAGMQADLVAVDLRRVVGPYLDADMPLLDALVQRAQGRDMRLTMVAGRILCRDGVLLAGNAAAIAASAGATALRHRAAAAGPEAAQAAVALGRSLRELHRI